MDTKDNKTDTNGECGHDTHLSNTECKRVETVNVLKDLNKSQDSFDFLIHEAADKMSKALLSNHLIQPNAAERIREHTRDCVTRLHVHPSVDETSREIVHVFKLENAPRIETFDGISSYFAQRSAHKYISHFHAIISIYS